MKVSKSWNALGTGATYTDPVNVEIRDGSDALVDTLVLTSSNGWEDTSIALLPGDYTFSEVTVPGWSPDYTPSNRTLTVVAGDVPVAGAIGSIENTIDTGCLKITKD